MAKKQLWNDGWSFVELPVAEANYSFPKEADWQNIDIPHDWMIYKTHDLYRDSIGWYKKEFTLEEVKGLFALRFDGARRERSASASPITESILRSCSVVGRSCSSPVGSP